MILFIRRTSLEALLFLHAGEALAAVNGTIFTGLEGHLAGFAAGGASGVEHLAGGTGGLLASVTAVLAALGLILEAAGSVEFLFTGGEYELIAALFAYQGLVLIHLLDSPL